MALALLAAVLLGFSRSYFLGPWFPEIVALAPPEPFFFVIHGTTFTAWMLMLVAQALLVANRQVALHRTIGWFGAVLAVAVLVVGTLGSLIAAGRPGGFKGAPVPPLEFLAIPLGDMALFGSFALLAVLRRADSQRHKRYMLLATIGLMGAAVVRWPFPVMVAEIFGPGFTVTDLGVDLFLVPMAAWDLASRGRLHRVTLIGGLVTVASQPLRYALSQTDAWRAFAAWAVGLL